MALRFVARRVAPQALRQASAPLCHRLQVLDLSSPAPLSNSTEVGPARKMRSAEMKKNAEKEIDDEVTEIRASFQKAREAIEEGRRNQMRQWKIAVASSAAGFALAAYTFSALDRKVRNIASGK